MDTQNDNSIYSVESHSSKKRGLYISVLNGNLGFVEMDSFNITVAQAVNKVVTSLRLPVEGDNGIKFKYFFYRSTTKTNDGYEILGELTASGEVTIFQEFGISEGTRLNLGAIILPPDENNGNGNYKEFSVSDETETIQEPEEETDFENFDFDDYGEDVYEC